MRTFSTDISLFGITWDAAIIVDNMVSLALIEMQEVEVNITIVLTDSPDGFTMAHAIREHGPAERRLDRECAYEAILHACKEDYTCLLRLILQQGRSVKARWYDAES